MVVAVEKSSLRQMGPWVVAGGVLLAIFAATFLFDDDPDPWDRRPFGGVADVEALQQRDDVNVLFILVDTLRAERMSAYGYERDTTPYLSRLARHGVRFARHMSQSSWTKSSMASLWTGLYPARTGVTRYDDVIPAEAVMATEVFRDAGFTTVGLYRNGWVAPTFGFDQGFEIYQRPPPTPLPPQVRRENPTLKDGATDEDLTQATIEFLRVNGQERWFLYLHLMDLHQYVYDAESAKFGSSYSDNYDNSILWTDGTLEILLENLEGFGLLDRTLVVLTADHGEAFQERGFEGHARRVYRETTEVPFLISFPFKLDPGVVIEGRTRNVDVFPTILDLVGLEPPSDIDGRSRRPEILAALRGEPIGERESVAVADLDQNWGKRDLGPLRTVAVSDGPFRYVRVQMPGGDPPVERLFDASSDPKEFVDIATTDPETLARLRAEAEAYSKTTPSWGEAPKREISELELNLLRALGYQVDD